MTTLEAISQARCCALIGWIWPHAYRWILSGGNESGLSELQALRLGDGDMPTGEAGQRKANVQLPLSARQVCAAGRGRSAEDSSELNTFKCADGVGWGGRGSHWQPGMQSPHRFCQPKHLSNFIFF